MREPKHPWSFIGWVLLLTLLAGASSSGPRAGTEPAGVVASPTGARLYRPYPDTHPLRPELPSPHTTSAGRELITVLTWDSRYAVVPVTVGREDGLMTRGPRDLKVSQLAVDERDFPTLAATGLHSASELAEAMAITGKPIERITADGRPGVRHPQSPLPRDQVGRIRPAPARAGTLPGDPAPAGRGPSGRDRTDGLRGLGRGPRDPDALTPRGLLVSAATRVLRRRRGDRGSTRAIARNSSL